MVSALERNLIWALRWFCVRVRSYWMVLWWRVCRTAKREVRRGWWKWWRMEDRWCLGGVRDWYCTEECFLFICFFSIWSELIIIILFIMAALRWSYLHCYVLWFRTLPDISGGTWIPSSWHWNFPVLIVLLDTKIRWFASRTIFFDLYQYFRYILRNPQHISLLLLSALSSQLVIPFYLSSPLFFPSWSPQG